MGLNQFKFFTKKKEPSGCPKGNKQTNKSKQVKWISFIVKQLLTVFPEMDNHV